MVTCDKKVAGDNLYVHGLIWLSRMAELVASLYRRRQQQQHLTVMLRSFYQYFALHHCDRKLSWIRHEVQRHWVHALQRRGQRQRISWGYLSDRPWFELPSARTLHPAV